MENAILFLVSMILSPIIGGFISWKVIDNKEKQRAKECMEQEKEVLYFSKLGSIFLKIIMGYVAGVFLYAISFLSYWGFTDNSVKESGIIFLVIFLFIMGFSTLWILARTYPLFAITNDSFIFWKNYGFSNSKKYNLSELTRKEFDIGRSHFVVFYRGNIRIKSFDSVAYKDKEKLMELLQQIPQKKKRGFY